MRILPKKIDQSWNDFLAKDILKELERIESLIGENYTPDFDKILRFFTQNLMKIKILILGQDPYPMQNAATGRSFEVGTLRRWDESFRQVSLKNILRLLYKNYNSLEGYADIPSFTDIKKMISNGSFNLLPPTSLFSDWEKQGVLLLNRYFTCEIGKPQSHRDIWHNFSDKLLDYINCKNENIIWFLWGKDAESILDKLNIKNKIVSRHPMMCSEKYESDFLKSDCFGKTKNIINWLGDNI